MTDDKGKPVTYASPAAIPSGIRSSREHRFDIDGEPPVTVVSVQREDARVLVRYLRHHGHYILTRAVPDESSKDLVEVLATAKDVDAILEAIIELEVEKITFRDRVSSTDYTAGLFLSLSFFFGFIWLVTFARLPEDLAWIRYILAGTTVTCLVLGVSSVFRQTSGPETYPFQCMRCEIGFLERARRCPGCGCTILSDIR